MALSNQQHNIISHIYEERRLRNIYEQERRKEEIYQKIPEFKEIEQQIIKTSMAHGRMLLKKEKDSASPSTQDPLHDLRMELLDLKMQKKKLLTDAGYPYDYLELRYDCCKCRDTGYIGTEKCTCFRQMEVEFLYDASQIKELLQTDNFSNLSYEYYQGESLRQFKEAVTTSQNFIKNFNSDYRNLFFYGTVGTGKSFLSGCIAKELLDRGSSIIYFSAVKMFQSISTLYYDKDKTALNNLFDTLYECDLLIIDDLGAECTNDFIRSNLFSILNERMLRHKSLIISTNLCLEELRERYSDRVFSRISRNFELCKLTGPDIRIQQKISMNYPM